MKEIDEIKEGKITERKQFVSREERQGNIPKTSKKEEKRNIEFNTIKLKILEEHHNEIMRLLAREGYYEYKKDKKGKPFYDPTDMLVRKISGGIMCIHKKDGYLNEMYVDDNEEELDQEAFDANLRTVIRCFPDVIFPDEWFGTLDKKRWIDVQIVVITICFSVTFKLKVMVKCFFEHKFYEDIEVLLDWYIDVKKVSKSRAFILVAGEIGKSSSYVRDHYT
jgi:hypothetical protein